MFSITRFVIRLSQVSTAESHRNFFYLSSFTCNQERRKRKESSFIPPFSELSREWWQRADLRPAAEGIRRNGNPISTLEDRHECWQEAGTNPINPILGKG